MNTKQYFLNSKFSNAKGIPTSIIATVLRETDKAVYLYGHGSPDPKGRCARCGRELTHPGSILLGIGPECLGNYKAREDLKQEAITELRKQQILAGLKSQMVDTWVPKTCIKEEMESAETVLPPENHKILSPKKSVQRQAIREGNTIKITFPFNRDDLATVKSIPGRRFDPATKIWTSPVSFDAIAILEYADFELSEDLKELNKQTKTTINTVEELSVPGLKKELFAFQKKGVAFIEAKGGRALIGDEMGLGKTVQALAWLQLHPEKRPVVIVCPASLKLNWEHEAHTWLPNPDIQLLQGTTIHQITSEIVIINYDILDAWKEKLAKIKPQVLILDESHYIKSNKARRTKATKWLAKKINHVIALSGTPIVNRPIEGFNAINLINSAVIPNFWEYAQRYCGAKHNGFGWDFTGASNTEELHQKLTQTVMLRRLKKDVLQDLPDKIHSFVPMELENKGTYTKAEENLTEYITEQKGREAAERASNAEQLAKIEVLKQLAVEGKMKQSIEWIENYLDSNGKLVVFATHKNVIDQLMEKFKEKAVKVDGRTSGVNRNAAVQTFQNDENVRLFIGNIQAAGVGLTLTAASTVVFLELPWTPAALVQAEDRCHRIGQKDSVNVYYLLAQGTIEEEIAYMLDSKRKVLDKILDGKETEQTSLLSEIIKKYQKKEKENA